MTAVQRFTSVLTGLIQIVFAILLICYPEDGYLLVVAALCLSLFLSGFRFLVYYFSMARYMVGGKAILFRGILLLNCALFTLSLSDIPQLYVVLYLLSVHAVTGVLDILRAVEGKRMQSAWKMNMAIGLANLIVAIGCIFCVKSIRMVVYVYAAGLSYAAILRLVSAFRRSAIVYIQ